MASFDERLLVVDTETTGTDVESDRIVELGACYFVERRYAEHRRMLIHPGRPIPDEASAIHGITDARVADKPPFAEVAARFVAHLDGSSAGGPPPHLCGYNAIGYDAPLINAELIRAGSDYRIDLERVHDPMIFVRWHMRGMRSRTLGALCEHFGITLDNAHSAAADAKATGQLLFRLIAEGLIPDDPEAALNEQAELSRRLAIEWDAYQYWLYRDREDGYLRMGAGKYCGEPLHEVDPGYLEFLLAKIEDLPPGVREELERHLEPA